MQNCWSEQKAEQYISEYGTKWGEDLALRTYLTLLLGADENLVLHGGGNTSVKTSRRNVLGETVPTLFVKASGLDMASLGPDGYAALDLEHLKKLRVLPELSDEDMLNEFRTHVLDCNCAAPSIETLVHAFIPRKYVDHTHADAILALTNQTGGERLVREALGADVLVLEYVKPGFRLACAAAAAFEANPDARAMVWMHHGLVSWGNTARESYETTVDLITRAESYLARNSRSFFSSEEATPVSLAQERLTHVAPVLRGLLARASGDPDQPFIRCIVRALTDRQTLDFVDAEQGKALALSPPLTSDHLIRTKALPLWVDHPQYGDGGALRKQLSDAIQAYVAEYDAYVERHISRMPAGVSRMDPLPRVVLMPGVGALCCGKDAAAAGIVRDITIHTLAVKTRIGTMGTYSGMKEADLFDMEYRGCQHAKLGNGKELPLARSVAIITGAAGAIGSGVAEGLLANGCHVALTDLSGDSLDRQLEELRAAHGDRVCRVAMDVTDPAAVAQAFAAVSRTWGGVDLVVANAGLAMVSPIASLDLESFRRLQRVNTEGTLLVLAEAARHFRLQGTGGDIILVSTKNVFAPGAKFGAYSATKAAAHQLARIASQEFAEIGVRVNMVAPDAVFAHGMRKSGLWAEVGPDRMSARGLSADGLEEYYRNRNLLKARVTARHVANAVLFFATRQTPTTGATIPVDGGLPDATPR